MRGRQLAFEVPGEHEGTPGLDSCDGGKVPVQVLAHRHGGVTLTSSSIALNLSFPPWSMGVARVEEGCGEMAPHTLPVGVGTATLVWRVIHTLDSYIPLEPAIHL